MIFQLKKAASSVLLSVFSFYLISGNLFRVVELSFLRDNILITEFFLYILSVLNLLMIGKCSRFVFFLILLVALSCCYGCIIHGFFLASAMHAIRLILMICSGYVLGELFYQKFRDSFESFLHYFLKIYSINALLGFLIYLLFPSSVDFWNLLARFGIVFHGDPHYGRFVSVYFDPNFFGAIGCLPFLFAFSTYKKSRRWQDLSKVLLFAAGVVLTLSRSGIATLIFMLVSLLVCHLRNIRYFMVRSGFFRIILLGILGAGFLIFFRSEQVEYFIHRFFHMKEDVSAQGRLDSFLFGIEVLEQNPVLGIGYDFLRLIGPELERFSSIDSSVLSTFIFFGIPLSICFFIWVGFWFRRLYQKLDQLKDAYLKFADFYQNIIIYVVICIVFSSQFNNLLYYQFWLIPILSIFSYMSCYLRQVVVMQKIVKRP